MRRLAREVERSKIILSTALDVKIEIDALHEGEDFMMHLTRDKFIKINKKNFDKVYPLITNCLKEAGLSKKQIDNVVVSGGSTKIPAVKEMLEKFFGADKLRCTVDPQEVTAAGAAILASQIKAGVLPQETEVVNRNGKTPCCTIF